jgi:hypothetical protein
MGDRTGVRKKKMATFLGGPLTVKVSIFCSSSGVFRQHFLSFLWSVFFCPTYGMDGFLKKVAPSVESNFPTFF